MMRNQSIYIRLNSFNHIELDKAVNQIIGIVKTYGGRIRGPIPLPRNDKVFVFNRSPHIDKESREKFEIRDSLRLLIIDSPTGELINAFNSFKLGGGIDVNIKLV